ncbi:ABC transporter ATP-binding protein [Hwanghaeella sp. 1Z406]|jgi:spermidine/putrescine transport system ATP-binding protein|uniref:ABC transporter ATP-binding protein n=1 Tax=Hwanghaeella sp. 1Z406 TaxID=3402811 RepID=UPI0026AF00BB
MSETSTLSDASKPSGEKSQRPMVTAENVTKSFGSGSYAVTALDNVSVTIRENEFFTLLGPSGCGKTTLLRLIAGFELPTKGSILLDGQEIGHLPPYKRPVNTVFQNYALFPHMTVAQNIAFGLEMLNKPKAEIDDTVKKMLALVQMGKLADRRTDQLSGGQQQRVALARALAPHPKVLLLDEPLSALDLKLRKEMQIELKRLQSETGITFVFVTHDQEEALTMSDRIAVMDTGHILQVGGPKDIYNHPARRFVADFIGDINIMNAEMLSVSDGHGTIRLSKGNEVKARLSSDTLKPGSVSVAIRPENVRLCDKSDSNCTVSGTISNVVYFGSGTNTHITLEDGTDVIARSSSGGGNPGEAIGLIFPDEHLQVLID